MLLCVRLGPWTVPSMQWYSQCHLKPTQTNMSHNIVWEIHDGPRLNPGATLIAGCFGRATLIAGCFGMSGHTVIH